MEAVVYREFIESDLFDSLSNFDDFPSIRTDGTNKIIVINDAICLDWNDEN